MEKNKFDFKEIMINVKRAWKYAKTNKKFLVIDFCFNIIVCVIGVIVPLLSAKIILNITGGLFEKLAIAACTLFLIEVIRRISIFIGDMMGQIFFLSTITEMQSVLAEETLKIETREIDKTSSGIFVDRLNQDAEDVTNVFIELSYSMTDLFSNIGILGAIFIVNKTMFVYSLISITILFIFEKIRMNKFFVMNKEYKSLREKNTGLITELVRGMRDIKLLNIENIFIDKTRGKIIEANDEKKQMFEISRKYNFIVQTLRKTFDLAFIFLGIYLVKINNLTIASFTIIYMYQASVQGFLNYFVYVIERLKRFNLSANRIFEVIENEKFKKEKFGKVHLDKVKGNFEFKNVEFNYDQKNEVLKGISFKIKPNETVAFVGKSGSGKTTIFSLLTKLYDITSGEILIDNVNINDLDKDSIRNNISIITQNPYIFNFSIKDNLKLVKPNATDEEIEEVCKIACLHEYIMSLSEQYDTMVGEGGITLSGGQRQRLAIARALLKKTEIILFDEATSALDNNTQQAIQEAINNMKGEYTILIIAHRLSTVIDSNRIILIDDGRVVAEGTHKEFIKNNELYKNLYNKELE